MGYYTSFSLNVKPDYEGNIVEKLRKECEYADFAMSESGGVNEPCKWYDHEKDMKNFSKKYPDELFELHGEGEESGDIWVKYFKKGKMQVSRAKIQFEDFDPAKLS